LGFFGALGGDLFFGHFQQQLPVYIGQLDQGASKFFEDGEQLGDYYLIEATDLDDAIKIAVRIPGRG